MTNFLAMGLPESLCHTLEQLKFTTPTDIQAEAIPLALAGHDILGSAQTGTGKTGAFGIPLISHLLANPHSTALVMTPTRELASQVMKQLQSFLGKNVNIKSALLIGGEAMPKQLQQLRKAPRLIVGTPGRINDHLKRRTLDISKTDYLVLDETDRMLDMGFTIQIEAVLTHMSPVRQTLLFSATLPKNIIRISEKYLNNPVRVAVSEVSAPAANLEQETIHINETEKYDRLLTELTARNGSVIIFVKTKHGADKLAMRLFKAGHKAEAIHGDLRQNKRDRVIANFRKQKYRILVATDVAARGLDIPHIEHVINYDLPQCAEDYIHRIGRTARAGAEGCALNFVSSADKSKWRAIECLLNPQLKTSRRKEERGSKPKTSFRPSGKKSNDTNRRKSDPSRRKKFRNSFSPKAA